jgi:hypothetical protein
MLRRPKGTHLAAGLAIAGLVLSGAALSAEPEDASDVTVRDALAEPSDPDDEADVRADHDPNDVGRRAYDRDLPDPDLGDEDLPDADLSDRDLDD